MSSIYRKGDEQSDAERLALHEHHNKQAGEIVKAIVKPIVDLGGSEGDAFVMLESVVVGVLLTMPPIGDERYLEMLLKNAKVRLAEQREANRKRAMN